MVGQVLSGPGLVGVLMGAIREVMRTKFRGLSRAIGRWGGWGGDIPDRGGVPEKGGE